MKSSIAVLLGFALYASGATSIIRHTNSADLVWKTNLFSATLEKALAITGPWVPVSNYATPCAEWKTFTINFNTNLIPDRSKGILPCTNCGGGTNGTFISERAFYRLASNDNGLVPTPFSHHAFNFFTNQIYLDTALLFDCNDNPIPIRYIYRRVLPAATSNLIASLTNAVVFLDLAPTGTTCNYYFQAGDHLNKSLVSTEVLTVNIP